MRKHLLGLMMMAALAALAGCGRPAGKPLDPDFARFVAAKRSQAQELADLQTNAVPGTVWKFFAAVEHNDWQRATNLFAQLQREGGRYSSPVPRRLTFAWAIEGLREKLGFAPGGSRALNTEVWSPIHEVLGAYEVRHDWDSKWLRRFGRDIIEAIPPGSIYFGGTDPGRFAITALSESHRQGRPFFTLTQNALADGTYLDYLRAMYPQLQLPSPIDSQQAFQEYLMDAQRRMKENRLKPGEDVRVVANRVQVSGQVAVMQINGLLVRFIHAHNTNREFYVEESFPLDWMYPYLAPHGLILKLHREPLPELAAAVVARDRDYWRKYTGELIGDWITEETTVAAVCEFGEKVYLRRDLTDFKGDPAFAQNEEARKTFAKLRSAIGGLYASRAEHSDSPAEKQRMTAEADLAFRQALALCPDLPEAVFRYVNLLLAQKRKADARLVAGTFSRLAPKDENLQQLQTKITGAE